MKLKGKTKNIIGQRFTKLTVKKFVGYVKGHARWSCSCDCGNQHEVNAYDLFKEHIKSCGCFQKEYMRSKMLKHGLAKGYEYQLWDGMNDRCRPTNKFEKHRYADRGIYVCDEWKRGQDKNQGLVNFVEWCNKNPRPDGYSLDRINNDGPYSPDNCRWATASQQSFNRRKPADAEPYKKFIKFLGKEEEFNKFREEYFLKL